MDLLGDLRLREQVASSMAESISLTRGVALYALAFFSMSRAYDLFILWGRKF